MVFFQNGQGAAHHSAALVPAGAEFKLRPQLIIRLFSKSRAVSARFTHNSFR